MKEKKPLEDKLIELSCKADQISAIAFCAINASMTSAELRVMYVDNVLYGIESLCEQISAELEDIAYSKELKGVSV